MKPKLLLHICCGPCAIAILKELQEKFDLTAYYYNPNIHPKKEYEKRKADVAKMCKELDIPFVEGPYDPETWFELTKEYGHEPEGGKRCPVCFRMRLEKTAQYASENNFKYFGTTITSGRNKKADMINPIGMDLGKKYGVKFYQEDWKKKGRQEISSKLCREKDVYKQNYCGCVYSIRD